MEVDAQIKAAGNGEDARDMLEGLGVRVGAAADQVGARLAGSDQQLFGARVVEETLLRENADLQVDRPRITARQFAHGMKALRPTRGSTSTWVRMCIVPAAMAHSKVRPRALEDVLLAKGALDARSFRNRFLEAAFDDAAAVDDAGLVEMNMGFDQAGHDEPAGGGLNQAGVGNGELRRDRRDAAVRDADVDHCLRVAGDARPREEEGRRS